MFFGLMMGHQERLHRASDCIWSAGGVLSLWELGLQELQGIQAIYSI